MSVSALSAEPLDVRTQNLVEGLTLIIISNKFEGQGRHLIFEFLMG